ncbi:unnamed protein product, partial [Symbiodinium microadriaticum]
ILRPKPPIPKRLQRGLRLVCALRQMPPRAASHLRRLLRSAPSNWTPTLQKPDCSWPCAKPCARQRKPRRRPRRSGSRAQAPRRRRLWPPERRQRSDRF